ncbi:MAG: hypothetical protein CM1200mP36_09190 [Gammaproteobacteria bacterium]|nr:MAG: hypothetical protein CM1200mP36_09190 [Gammaproteobacteria bacterium]
MGWLATRYATGGGAPSHLPANRHQNGQPIEGVVRSDVIVPTKVFSHSLGNRGHVAYPVSDPEDPRNVLTVRNGMTGTRQVIPREDWQFARFENERVVPDPTMVYLSTGFEPDHIYDVVYVPPEPSTRRAGARGNT